MRSTFPRLFLLILVPACWALSAAPATRPSSPEFTDLMGVIRRPLEMGAARAAVIIFISTDCPISNGYAPEINRICKEYEEKGVAFYLVHTDPELTTADAKKHASEYAFTCPVMIDRKHELVRRVGATLTPEAVVVGSEGRILYRGRIDDLYVSLGKRRYEATTHDLRLALDAVLAGKPVVNPRTTTVGCAISN